MLWGSHSSKHLHVLFVTYPYPYPSCWGLQSNKKSWLMSQSSSLSKTVSYGQAADLVQALTVSHENEWLLSLTMVAQIVTVVLACFCPFSGKEMLASCRTEPTSKRTGSLYRATHTRYIVQCGVICWFITRNTHKRYAIQVKADLLECADLPGKCD